MKRNLILALAASVPFLAACSGGSNNNGDTATVASDALCPSSIDYSTVWTGGSGSGEVVKFQMDTTKLTWQLTYLDSFVPLAKGTAKPSRQGETMSGTMTRETELPTQNLNNCTFRLNSAYVTGTSTSGVDTFNDNESQPARIFVGQGIMGGMIPGKEIQFNGIDIAASVENTLLGSEISSALTSAGLSSSSITTLIDQAIGVNGDGIVAEIPDVTLRYIPFLAFSSVNTNLSSAMSTLASESPFTQLGFSLEATRNFAVNAIQAKWTFNSDGSYTKCDTFGQNAGKCVASNTPDPEDSSVTDNKPFVNTTDGSNVFETDNYQGQEPPYQLPALVADLYPGANAAAGKGMLILGNVNGGLVPLLIRRGVVNIPTLIGGTDSTANVDDEIGISLMFPQTTIAQGGVDGEYITVDSVLNGTTSSPGGNDNQFNYRAILLVGTEATIIDPFNASDTATAAALNIGYTQSTPGSLTVQNTSTGGNGTMIFGNHAVAYLDNSGSTPYFTAGAFVQ